MNRGAVERYRLALFGRMVMGVAHEIDNHLSVVLGYSELVMLTAQDGKKAAETAGKIFSAGEKIGVIVRHFSRFVRPHDPVADLFSPRELLGELLPFSRYDLGRGSVALSFPEEIPPGLVAADKRDFALALLAVLFNGAEAMAERGGALRLAVERDGPFLEFRVTDEGGGISDADMSRVFEEGFTRKSAPVHGGMGLPVARHVVAEMGGTLAVANLPGGGCAATIRVPVR